MNYTLENFLQDVAYEVKSLREVATKDELKKLNTFYFNPNNIEKCIYGLMTGTCMSHRAAELMEECVKSFFVNISVGDIESIGEQLIYPNEYRKNTTWILNAREHGPNVLTALEHFLMFPEAEPSIKNVIDYLNGKTDILELPITK